MNERCKQWPLSIVMLPIVQLGRPCPKDLDLERANEVIQSKTGVVQVVDTLCWEIVRGFYHCEAIDAEE